MGSPITVTIHRGSHEIGGNCVELATAKSRLILDVGMPLSEMMGDGASRRRKPDRDDLVRRGVMKEIPGLFSPGPKIDGILLSHAHGDHFGLIEQTLPDIPIYLGRGTSKMLMAGNFFAGQNGLPRERKKVILHPGKRRRIGDFHVTAYLVDHSSYGSMAFLIDAHGKRIVYSGDLRLHGRKPGMARDLLKAIRQAPLDLLIMEGTSLSRGQKPGPSEQDVETQLVKSLKQTSGLALAMFSPQNVDRLVSYYRAAIRTGRTLILDPYAAFVLHLIKNECKVPDPFESQHIRIFIPDWYLQSSAGVRLRKHAPAMKKVEITLPEILAAPQNFLMIFRESIYERVFNKQLPPGSRLFYSYWPGYLDQPASKKFRSQIENSGCAFELAHASGHIYYQDIMEFVRKADPHRLMPIHTVAAKEMAKEFPKRIIHLSDGNPHVIMNEYPETLPLVYRYKKEKYNSSKLGEQAKQLNTDIARIREEFDMTSQKAPNRASDYLGIGILRHGTIKEPKNYSRVEEHLALALFNQYTAPNPLTQSSKEKVAFIDYQVPLKNKKCDVIGKLDLLGVTNEMLAIVELKAFLGKDTPVKALLEALAYAAIVKNEENFKKIRAELGKKGFAIGNTIQILIMAPSSYWDRFQNQGEGWKSELKKFADKFRSDIFIKFISVEMTPLDLMANNLLGNGMVKPVFTKKPSSFRILFES